MHPIQYDPRFSRIKWNKYMYAFGRNSKHLCL